MAAQENAPSFVEERKALRDAAASGWAEFNARILSGTRNDLVHAEWSVGYDPLGHDVVLEAKVAVSYSSDSLLQVWLMDQHSGIWIPEYRPWVSSVVEYTREQAQKSTHVGLFDSKWRDEDKGETYNALLWGWVAHKDDVKKFAFSEEFQYPG